MSDDLVKRLRGWRGFHQANLSIEAADRIEALTAERDHAWAMVAKADTQVGQSLADHMQAKAERDRLRDALEQIAQWSEAYPTEVFPEPDFARAAAALASSGMSIDAVSASNMRHATKGVGKIARAAMKGESHE